MTGMAKLFAAQAADANSGDIEFQGGLVTMVMQLVSGTATLKAQMSPDDGTTWVNIDSMSLTASGTKTSAAPLPRCKVRLNQSSSSTPVVNGWIGNCSG